MPLDHPEEDSFRFVNFVTPFLTYWRTLFKATVACVTLFGIASLVLPRRYTAETTFMPHSGGADAVPGALATFAGQFGINLLSDGADSPDFYAKILTSRGILEAALLSNFVDPEQEADSARLLDILNIKGRSASDQLERGLREFESMVAVSVDKRTGIVTLRVELRSAVLAASVANTLVELLNQFNLSRLQTQSGEQRRFAGERVAQAEVELQQAEDSLLTFLTSNRRYADSPILIHEFERLQRRVQLRQDIVTTLRRDYEQARIAEVRDTPVLTVVDPATPPEKKSSPRTLMNLLLGGVLGVTLGGVLVYVRDLQATALVEQSPSYEALATAWRLAKQDLARFLLFKRP